MGLESFTTEDEEEESGNTISTRKKLENVSMDRWFWEILVTSHPGVIESASSFTNDSSSKAMVLLIDEALDDEIEGIEVSDDHAEELEEIREEIVEEHL